MYNPTPWQATSDCSSPNPGDCHWDLKVDTSCTGNCHGAVADGKITIGETAFSTNYTMAPGLEPTLPEEMFDDWLPEWRRVTWTGRGEFGLNPWNAPGRVVRLDIEDCSEELLRQQSYVIKNQLGHPKHPTTRNAKYPHPFGCPSWFFMA